MFSESRNPQANAAARLAWCLSLCLTVSAAAADTQSRVSAMVPFAMPPPTKARVVIQQNPAATRTFMPQLGVIRDMVDQGVLSVTRQATLTQAWRSLVSTQDVVGIKVYSAPGELSGTRPAVVEAVVTSLLAAGQPSSNVVIWDRQMVNLRQSGFVALAERQGVRVAASAEAGYDTNEFYANAILGQLVHGDHEFGTDGETLGRNSYVSKLVSQGMTKIISIAPMLNHNLTGVSGHLASVALGSVDNTFRFTSDASRLAVAVPEIYALPVLGDRVVLNITDALIAQYYGEEIQRLHYSAVLNQLRFSTDPVALDVLSIRELELQRERAGMPAVKADLALYQNASLVQNGVSDFNQIQVELSP